jgi:GT2 family glycosyltransferase
MDFHKMITTSDRDANSKDFSATRFQGQSDLSNHMRDSTTPLVYCIVLNWNGWEDTNACLAALREQDYAKLSVVVVDNASTDGSVERITSAFPSVRLIRNQSNCGFSAGNNVGIRIALQEGADYVWLLNNDTAFPSDTATKLVAKAVSDPSVGEVGSVFYHMSAPELLQVWGGATLPSWRMYSPRIVTSPCHFGKDRALMAASVLLRRSTLVQVGLLDEAFFADFEDSDLSFRVRKAGWKLAVAEDTRILHKGGASFARSDTARKKFSIASQYRFIRKHARFPTIMVLLWVSFEVLKQIRKWDWRALNEYLNYVVNAAR